MPSSWAGPFSQYGVLFFFIGFLSGQKFNLFGEIYIGEIFCGLVLLLNIRHLRIPPGGKQLLTLLFIWFVAQFLSDVVNETELTKSIKGVLVPVFISVILLGLTALFHRRYKYLPIYLMGLFIGILATKLIHGHLYFISNPWKWGVGVSVALSFFTWIEFYCKNNRSFYLLIVSAMFVIMSLANSSRLMAFFMLIPSLIAIFSNLIINNKIYRKLGSSPYGFLPLFATLVVAILVMDRSLAALFTFQPFLDLVPSSDAFKYSVQSESKWGVILGGRTELLVSLKAFFNSPLLGHGSWPENPYYAYALLEKMYESGGMLQSLDIAKQNLNSFLIPTHSYLMGAMVWGGFFAGLFWLKILGLSISGFLNERVISSPLLLHITFVLIWGTLFSPFGADARWLVTVLLWVYISMVSNSNFKKV